MLPRGVWPQWCEVCMGSGLIYCPRCGGTGRRRAPIGFRIPDANDESDDADDDAAAKG